MGLSGTLSAIAPAGPLIAEHEVACLDVAFASAVAYAMPHDMTVHVGRTGDHYEPSVALACEIHFDGACHRDINVLTRPVYIYTMKKIAAISILVVLGLCLMAPVFIEDADGRVSTVEFYSEGEFLGMTYTDNKGFFKLLEPNPTSDTGEFQYWVNDNGSVFKPRPAQYDNTFYTPKDIRLYAVFEPVPEEPEQEGTPVIYSVIAGILCSIILAIMIYYHFIKK